LLSDRRVVEFPRLLWLPALHGALLPFAAWHAARRFRRMWNEHGAAALAVAEELRSALARELGSRVVAPFAVESATLYGAPSIRGALARLFESGAQRILVLPLYPQYSAATTAAVYDQVNAELRRWRWIPELRFIAGYHDHPGYIEALRASVAAQWETGGRTQHLLISFHGLPEFCFRNGDPYYCKCQKTARLLAEELNLADGDWSVSFQSRLGVRKWLGPDTAEVLAELPKRDVRSVTVACPGFPIDELETLEQIAITDRERFLEAGGRRFHYVTALNGRPEHARALADLVAQHCQGWTAVNVGWLAAASALRGVKARDD
jgi:ferrochelatase